MERTRSLEGLCGFVLSLLPFLNSQGPERAAHTGSFPGVGRVLFSGGAKPLKGVIPPLHTGPRNLGAWRL